jgi:hypothetical protein
MWRKSRTCRWAWVGIVGAMLARPCAGATPADDPGLPPLPPESPSGNLMAPAPGAGEFMAPAADPPGPGGLTPPLETETTDGPRPNFLRRPLEAPPEPPPPDQPITSMFPRFGRFFRTPVDPPIGFAGRSSVIPSEVQTSDDFVPVEDRWRIGYPFWDRYGNGHRLDDDYPFAPGFLRDPFNLNVLKGDYPIAGQHTFLEVIAKSDLLIEGRTIPTATTPFESTARPFQTNFFGRPNQLLYLHNFSLDFDLFHGDAGFKPTDWRIRVNPIYNLNSLFVEELGVVSPNTLAGVERNRTWFALQQWFGEIKIADTSPYYDFVSVRAGSQPFVVDFRGFLFADINRGVRLFGSRNANRDQFNIVYFRQLEKDTNSGLNSFNDRDQNLIFMNYYRQDFIFPGYTAQVSLTYNNDQPTIKFDKNRFLVRPDPVGITRPHKVDVAYLGWAGDGHIGRYNITHQFYWAFGRDTNNPIGNRAQTINAQFFAIEGSYDRDWVRFRTSFLWSSGDHNVNNTHATGFDTILDNPNFAGGGFSFFQRQFIPLFGVGLKQRNSLVPDLRSSKIQGQANFVNPGLLLCNFGIDFELTPKIKSINNANLLWFDQTNVLQQYLFDGSIDKHIGADLSTGIEYRPLASENVMFVGGFAMLIPGQGFRDLYNNADDRVDSLLQGFLNFILLY